MIGACNPLGLKAAVIGKWAYLAGRLIQTMLMLGWEQLESSVGIFKTHKGTHSILATLRKFDIAIETHHS